MCDSEYSLCDNKFGTFIEFINHIQEHKTEIEQMYIEYLKLLREGFKN